MAQVAKRGQILANLHIRHTQRVAKLAARNLVNIIVEQPFQAAQVETEAAHACA